MAGAQATDAETMARGVAPTLDDRNEAAAVGADAGSMRATARSETLRLMWWWTDDRWAGRQEGSRCDGRIEGKGWLDGG